MKKLLLFLTALYIVMLSLYPGGRVEASCNADIPPGFSGVDCPTNPITDLENLDPTWARMCSECLENVVTDATSTSFVNPPGTGIPTYDPGERETDIASIRLTQDAWFATHTGEPIIVTLTALADTSTPTPIAYTPTPTYTLTSTPTPTLTPSVTPAGYMYLWQSDIYEYTMSGEIPSGGWKYEYISGPGSGGSEVVGFCIELVYLIAGIQKGWGVTSVVSSRFNPGNYMTAAASTALGQGNSNLSAIDQKSMCFDFVRNSVASSNYYNPQSVYIFANDYSPTYISLRARWRYLYAEPVSGTPTPVYTLTSTPVYTLTATSAYTLTATSAAFTATAAYFENLLTQQVPNTPEPTVTPGMPRLDCTTPEYTDGGVALDWDGMIYWGNTCTTAFPGISYDLPEIGSFPGYSLSIPEFTLCVDWYTPPNFTIAGITIPVIPIIAAPAIAFLIRSFLRL